MKKYKTVRSEEVRNWYKAGLITDFYRNGGSCIKYKDKQIAVFNFNREDKWYACQNLCPHKMEMILSRGMIGDDGGVAKIACPMHKKTFSLETGENLNGDLEAIATFPVRIDEKYIYVGFID